MKKHAKSAEEKKSLSSPHISQVVTSSMKSEDLASVSAFHAQQMSTILSSLPGASVNNSRSIVRSWIDQFKKKRSPSLAQKIERVTGLDADYQVEDEDFFEPRGFNNNEE